MDRISITSLYIMTFVLALSSIVYELLIAQTISFYAANTVVWYSITIGLYLGTMGIGALALNRFFRNSEKNIESLFQTEVFLTIFGASAVLLISSAHSIHLFLIPRTPEIVGIFTFFLWALAMVAVIGFLTGLELPLLIKIAGSVSGRNKTSNNILGVDYVGSLAGTLVFALILLPRFDLISIGFFIASLNALTAFYILYAGFLYKKFTNLVPIFVLSVMLTAGIINSQSVEQYFLKKYYYFAEAGEKIATLISPMKDLPYIERINSPYQKIDIVRTAGPEPTERIIDAYSKKYELDPNYPRNYSLYINGDFQFYSNVEEIYHEYFAHVPIIESGEIPKKILILGGGDGLLLRELLKYSTVKKVTLVDIDKKMIETARIHPVISYINDGSFEDPRVEVLIDDAFHFIKNSGSTYDAIYLDFPPVKDYNISRLYSYEFYSLVKKRLSDNGFMALDSPGADVFLRQNETGELVYAAGNIRNIYLQTIRSAGFEKVLSFSSKIEAENENAAKIIGKYDSYLLETYKLLTGTGNEVIQKANETELTYMKSYAVREILDNFVKVNSQSFVMAKKVRGSMKHDYKNLGISLNILNENRYKLAFNKYSEYKDMPEKKNINSIMRPVLLNLFSWQPKRPY